jgi:hypothetical protein
MNEIFFDLGVSAILTTLKAKMGAKKKAQMKSVFLKIFKAIKASYADDPDFE